MKTGAIKKIPQRCGTLISAIVWEVDTITIRAIMAAASLCFAVALIISPMPFTQEAYSIMAWVGEQWLWSGIFVAYGAGTGKLLWDDVFKGIHRASANRWFNLYGFVIWGFYILAVILALGYYPPSMSLYSITVPLLGWAIVRTAPPRRVR